MTSVSFPAAAADPSQIAAADPAPRELSLESGKPAADAALDRPDRAPTELSEQLISVARSAAVEEAGSSGPVGVYLGAVAEDEVAVSAAFAASDRGYRGWYWSVTLAVVSPQRPTISEVTLLPGAQALLAPPWVPWDRRIRAGDVGTGDLLPAAPDDIRLVPSYCDSDDPAVMELAYEFGLGRTRVLSREGRDDAAQRWHDGPFGPDAAVASATLANCVTCGFYVPLAGLLGMALGACTNEFSPADGRVVDADYGCGAHSETVIDAPMISASSDSVVDELTLEVHYHRAPVMTAQPDLLPDPMIDPMLTAAVEPELEPEPDTAEPGIHELGLAEQGLAEQGSAEQRSAELGLAEQGAVDHGAVDQLDDQPDPTP